MIFKKHDNLLGLHAFLGASQYHWINYDAPKLEETYNSFLAKQRGTELHDFAARCIKLGIKLPKTQTTLNMYVNDAIGFRMTPEQPLYYSDNCFGTADAIAYDNKKKLLRISDLKTGTIPANIHQLEIYMALFCLEYSMSPYEMDAILRIYQSNDIQESYPDKDFIKYIMDKIIDFDERIQSIKGGARML